MTAKEAQEISKNANNVDLTPIFGQIKAHAMAGANSTVFHLQGRFKENVRDVIDRLRQEGYAVKREKDSDSDKLLVAW